MSSFFNCAVYEDIAATIRLDGHVIFLALDDANTSIHLTLNPFQVRTLAKYLYDALAHVELKDLQDEKNFGDLAVQIVNEDNSFVDYALAVPF